MVFDFFGCHDEEEFLNNDLKQKKDYSRSCALLMPTESSTVYVCPGFHSVVTYQERLKLRIATNMKIEDVIIHF